MTATGGAAEPVPTAAHDADPAGENTVIKQVTPTRPPRKILSRALCLALHDAGLIPGDLANIRRVVLDLEPARAAMLYVDYYTDERWLDVVRVLDGVEVITRPQPENAAPAPS